MIAPEAMTYTGIENIVDEHKQVDLVSADFLNERQAVKTPITRFNALLKLLRKAITAYGRTNKVNRGDTPSDSCSAQKIPG